MTVQTTSTLTNSIRGRYQNFYEEGLLAQRVYDMYASPVGANLEQLMRGTHTHIETRALQYPDSKMS